MLNRLNQWILAILFFSTVIPAVSFGYEEIDVKAGGTLTGKVTLKGPPPQARIFHLITSPNMEFCGKISDGKGNRLLEEFSIDEEGGFNNVVVLIVGIEKGKPFNYTPEVNVQNCQISPFVAPVRNHHEINLINHDPVIHDVQTYTLKDQYTFAMFNKPLTPKETVVKQVRFRPGHYIFRVQCGVHAFMQSWGIGVGNPYFTVTSNNGTYSISDIPPGEYDVIAWHPLMEPAVQRIKIPSNGKIDASFEFNSKNVHIPEHDLQTGYRFDTALQSDKIPAPTILPQHSWAVE